MLQSGMQISWSLLVPVAVVQASQEPLLIQFGLAKLGGKQDIGPAQGSRKGRIPDNHS